MHAPTLRTARLVLRPVADADADAIVAALSDWQVTRWLSGPPWPFTRADADHWIANGAVGSRAITLGGTMIGSIGIKPDLGYWLAPAHHGRGLMTEAARTVVAHHFAAGGGDIVSGHFPGNIASRAVLTRLGFVDTQVERAHARPLGRDVDIQRMLLARPCGQPRP